jgi:hypothetical protein
MNRTKADNIASIYGLKERKRLAAVVESNTFIGDAVEAFKLHAKQETRGSSTYKERAIAG